jgi:hypothetical protein
VELRKIGLSMKRHVRRLPNRPEKYRALFGATLNIKRKLFALFVIGRSKMDIA